MDPKIRQVFIPLVAFILPVAVLLPVNLKAQKQNTELLQKSQQLEASLNTVEAKYKGLIDGLEKDKKNLKDSLESLKRENESIQFQLKKIETQTEAAVDEKTYLEEMLIHKTKEIEAMKAGGIVPASATTAAGDLSDQIRSKDAEIKRLLDENRTLAVKLESLYQTTNQKISEINVAKIALEDTVSSARENIDNQYGSVNLGTINVDKEKSAAKKPDVKKNIFGQPKPPARKEAHVLAINDDHGFVVVDVGKVDNISANTKLEVRKAGQTIATLSVLEVRDVMTACNVRNIVEGAKIQVNDPVTILK